MSRTFAKFAAGFEIVHGVDFHARCQNISYLDTGASRPIRSPATAGHKWTVLLILSFIVYELTFTNETLYL